MTTKTRQLLEFLDSNGDVLSDKFEINVHDLQDTDFSSGDEDANEFLTYNGQKFVPQNITAFNFSGYATETYVDTQISNIIDGADTAFDTFEEIATLIENNTQFAEDANDFLKRNKYRVYTGDGTRTVFGIHHYSGNVDVWLNGVKLIPKVIDFDDTNGLNNLTSGNYDYISLGDDSSTPYNLKLTASHSSPFYGLHWRTNFDSSQLLSKTNIDAYALYNFNSSSLPQSFISYLNSAGIGAILRLQFSTNIVDSSYYDSTGQNDYFSYVAQYLGFYNANLPVPAGDTALPSYSSPYFSEGPIGQIGSPYEIDFYQLEEKNAQILCSAIQFETAPSLNDVIILRGY